MSRRRLQVTADIINKDTTVSAVCAAAVEIRKLLVIGIYIGSSKSL